MIVPPFVEEGSGAARGGGFFHDLDRRVVPRMMASHDPGQDVIVASIEGAGATFAITRPADHYRPRAIASFDDQAVPTFSTALLAYAKEQGLSLTDRALAIAIAGTVRGDTARATNGRWFVSWSGLEQMLRRRPVIINDVVAVAWSLGSLGAASLRPIGNSPTNGGGASRRAVIWIGAGLGAGCLGETAGGAAFVVDCEGGHSSFAPATTAQAALFEQVNRRLGHVSYERILTLPASDPSWSAMGPDMTGTKLRQAKAAILGSFCGNIALMFGAWDGVYVAGPQAADLTAPDVADHFRTAFLDKGRMNRNLVAVPTWRIEQQNLALLGAAACLTAQESQA